MSHTRASQAAAEREASERSILAERAGSNRRFRAQRYPNGTDHIDSWPWGVMELELNYFPDGRSDRTRQVGFVWERN